MNVKIHEPSKIVEVMLTHAEQADETVKQQLKELYAQYKGTKYTVAVFLSGKRDLVQSPPCCRAGSAGTQGGRSVSTVRQRRFRFLLCQIFCRLQW